MAACQRQAPPRAVCTITLLLATLALLQPASPASAADAVEADTFISDTERFPGWKGTLPGVKYATDAASSGDPNHARSMAHGSLGEVITFWSCFIRYRCGTHPGYPACHNYRQQRPSNTALGSLHRAGKQVEWDGEVEQLSWAPRLFLYKRFLSDAECDHLIDKVPLASPHNIMPLGPCSQRCSSPAA